MRFLTAEASLAREKRIWRQLGNATGRPGAARGFIYHDKAPDYGGAARAIVATIEPFTEAALLFSGTPFGDGWDKLDSEYPLWRKFYAWRNAHGELHRLYQLPGHIFDGSDGVELVTCIAFALELHWDALLAARPGRNVLSLSHDERIEFHVGFKHRALATELEKLGFCLSA
jgi:hypothetical protein